MEPGSREPARGRPAPEAVLYRCGCSHCDQAEAELRSLAGLCGAALVVRTVKAEGIDELAGWATPVVYVNGLEISHYTMDHAAWKKAMEQPLARVRLRGEVVDYDCYLKERARGPGHAECAAQCVNELKLPLGLSADDGRLYRLAAGLRSPGGYEALKERLGERVEVAGDLFFWRGKWSLIVRQA